MEDLIDPSLVGKYNFKAKKVRRAYRSHSRLKLKPKPNDNIISEEHQKFQKKKHKGKMILGRAQRKKQFTKEFSTWLNHKNRPKTDDLEQFTRSEFNQKLEYPFTQTDSTNTGNNENWQRKGSIYKNAQMTDYFDIIKHHYRLIKKDSKIQTKKGVRRGDLIQFFFENHSLLKLHDFTPANFIICVNEVNSSSPHSLSLKDFHTLIQEPREKVTTEEINNFSLRTLWPLRAIASITTVC